MFNVVQRVGSKNISHKSVAGAVQNALVMATQGTETERIVAPGVTINGMEAIRAEGKRLGIRPMMAWVDKPDNFIHKGVAYIDGKPIDSARTRPVRPARRRR